MSRARGRWLLLALLLAFSGPVWLQGKVIFPHDNRVELGLLPQPHASSPANRKFSDQSSLYVPELHHQLHGAAAGWLSTWNPHVELGRPVAHISGFSRAFALSHLLSRCTDDAIELYTWLAIAALSLTALFACLFFESLGLHPAASTAGALGIGFGVFCPYWLGFAMFLWGLCWTLALLWLVTLFAGRATLARGAGIAFALHALLLTGYPQQIVWHAYLVGGYALFALLRRAPPASRLSTALGLAAAAALGLASAAPVYLDLALDASRSARLGADPAFFAEALPVVSGWRDLAAQLALWSDAAWLGNPVAADYPVRFSGMSAPPPLLSLALLSLLDGMPRRLWPAQVFAGVCLALALCPPAYGFGVRYLGLGLSRFSPAAAALLPIAVLAACAADFVIRRGLKRRGLGLALVLLPALLAAGHLGSAAPLRAVPVWNGLALLAGTALFAATRLPAVLLLVSGASALVYAFPLRLMRPPEEIARDSPLVDAIRAATQDGSRFAWLGGTLGALPSNQEAWLGLRSIHSYNSLSARAYQRWVEELSPAGTQDGGRFFRSIEPGGPPPSPRLAAAGVGVLLARGGGAPPGAGPLLAREGGVAIYRTREPPRLEAQLPHFRLTGPGAASLPEGSGEAGLLPVERTLARDDRLRFRVSASDAPTLLFVSQQCHPSWRAEARGTPLETVCIDGFYQGVVLPPGALEVELRFAPLARFSWLPQLGFAAAALALAARSLLRRRSADSGRGRAELIA